MNRLLLAFVFLIATTTAFAQQPYDIEAAKKVAVENKAPGLVGSYKGTRVYFDPEEKMYFLEDEFKRKYGIQAVSSLDSLRRAELSLIAPAPLVVEPPQIAKKEKRFALNDKTIDPSLNEYRHDYKGDIFRWRLNTVNTVVGCSLIGASVATYLIGSSAVETKINNLKVDDFKKLEDYTEEVESFGKTKRTIAYVCAGTSLAGVIVVLCGLHKEYAQGINIGHNATLSDNGAGIMLTKRF